MKVRKLHEANELETRAAQHKKKQKGLSPFCSLNTDAGNVEHNISMFNTMNTPVGGPSNNPISGPHGGDVVCESTDSSSTNKIDLFYDDLEIEVVSRSGRCPSYSFRYGYDEPETRTVTVSHELSVPQSEIEEVIAWNLTDEDYQQFDDSVDGAIWKFIEDNFDRLLDKYESKVLAHFEDRARNAAERYYDYRRMNESANEWIIVGITKEGDKQYYNVSSAPHWSSKMADASKFDDKNEAKQIWFKLRDKSFSKIEVVEYDVDDLHEAVDYELRDKQELLRDSISDMMDFVVGKHFLTRYRFTDTWKVETKNGHHILTVQFDTQDPDAGFVFSIDGNNAHRVKTSKEAANIIIDTANRKHTKSFDLAVESVQEGWTPPEGWMSYKGAWIYPVSDGFEANFMGQHFQGATIDDIKIKLANARMHMQHFSGELEKASKFADNIKKFGRELTEDHHEATKDGLSSTDESWKPDLVDCPACGDTSFNSKRGRCTKCSYRESLCESTELKQVCRFGFPATGIPCTNWLEISDSDAEARAKKMSAENPNDIYYVRYNDVMDSSSDIRWINGKEYDASNVRMSSGKPHVLVGSDWVEAETVTNSIKEWYEFSDDDFEDDQMHAAVYGGDSKYCKLCGTVKEYDEDGFAFCPKCDKDDEGKLVGISFDVTAPFDMKESEIESIIRKAVNSTELDIPGYMEIHTLDESLTEASYGGAYDIADDQYFTRDDLVNCSEKVIEHLNETFDDTFQIADVRLEGPNMILEVDGEKLGWYMEKCNIDMRRIRVPSDLTDKYALELASKLIDQIKNYNQM